MSIVFYAFDKRRFSIQIVSKGSAITFNKKNITFQLKLRKSQIFHATSFRKNPFNEMSFFVPRASVLDLTTKLYITFL